MDKESENYLNIIEREEPEMGQAIKELLKQIAGCYGDKYEGAKNLLDTKKQLYDPIRGGIINAYQCLKYLQRFMSEGFAKSGNKNDLLKVCHYSLFDVIRLNRIAESTKVTNEDIVEK